MIDREQAFKTLSEIINDELVVTGIGTQTLSWFQVKHRPENLYLLGPMGLAPAVGLGVALAHPETKVVVIEGDGSLLMALSSLVAIAHSQPKNFMLICMDNGIYESGGKGPTINTGTTDFVKTAQGIGIPLTKTVDDQRALEVAIKELLQKWECSFLHVKVAPLKAPIKPPKLKPFEIKYQFLDAMKRFG